jgi:hypothetical protein
MDFKTRFQGKTSHITKDGGIEDLVQTTNIPINKGETQSKITIGNKNAFDQLIQYAPDQGQPK